MKREDLIYVSGHSGMVGDAVCMLLGVLGFENILTFPKHQLDLRDQKSVMDMFYEHEPSYVINCAAFVGGIAENVARPAEFLLDNLQIATNVISAARMAGVKRLCFLGSSCAYPKSQGILRETFLLDGKPEITNLPYAVAKIAGIELCNAFHKQYGCDYYSLIPCNLYGPHDNFDRDSSHVVPALIRKFSDARGLDIPVTLLGDGSAERELMYVDDLASAIIITMMYDGVIPWRVMNVGTGDEIRISSLAEKIAAIVKYEGKISYSGEMNGAARKIVDPHRIRGLGWRPKVGLDEGLERTIDWYRNDRETPF
jgi:GDP-L-fucose synthase